MDWTSIFTPSMQLVLGGAAGGVARWIFVQPKAWSDRLGMVVLGAIFGFYVSPQFAPTILDVMTGGLIFGIHFAVDTDKFPGFAAFATGGGAIFLIGLAVDWATNFRRQRSQDGAVDPLPKPDGGKP